MKRIITTAGIFLVGLLLGLLIEKHKWTEYVWSEPDWIAESPIIIHMCACIEDNPESYNTLLDEAERINDEIQAETIRFLKLNGLKSFDMKAVIRVKRNGNPGFSVWCSERSPKVKRLFEDYQNLIAPFLARYDSVFNKVHDEHCLSKTNDNRMNESDGEPSASPQGNPHQSGGDD